MVLIIVLLSEIGEKLSSVSVILFYSKGSVNWLGNNRVLKLMKVVVINI